MFEPTPYAAAYAVIQQHQGTGGAGRLAKLLLSLYNSDCGFAISECLAGQDSNLTRITVECVQYYAKHGEDQTLRTIGRSLVDEFPGLWEIGKVQTAARYELRKQWEQQQAEENARLYPDG